MSILKKYVVDCQDESQNFNYWIEEGVDTPPTECPNDPGHSVVISIKKTVGDETQKDSENAVVTRLKKSSWGRMYQKRYAKFSTATLNSILDKTWEKQDHGHASLLFYDSNGIMNDPDQAALDNGCIQTRLRIAVDYDCEVALARMHVPATLDAPETDWLYAFIMAPDVVNLPLTGLCPLSHFKNLHVDLGSDLEVMKIEPDMLGGQPVPGGHIMDFIIYHPQGAKQEFLFEFEHYK